MEAMIHRGPSESSESLTLSRHESSSRGGPLPANGDRLLRHRQANDTRMTLHTEAPALRHQLPAPPAGWATLSSLSTICGF